MSNNQTKPDNTIALNTFTKLMRAAESVSVDVHKHLAGKGLTISQFGILEALFHLGPMPQKTVARKILKSQGNITMVIDNLEKRGLVSRERNSEDRRSFIVKLTDLGDRCIADLFPDHADIINHRMTRLNESEQKELGRLLKKLGTDSKSDHRQP